MNLKAVTYAAYGGPDVLKLHDVPVPAPSRGQVRVRVRAAAVNPADCKIRSGAWGTTRPLPAIPGLDVAGVVDAVGPDAEFVIGDKVFGHAVGGSYAEYALASTVAIKPAELDWDSAVAIPTSGAAALRALNLLDLTAGRTLLVNGAAGSVGTFAVQLALREGITVIGTSSPTHHDSLRQLGVIPTTYGDGLIERVGALAPLGIDAALDAAGRGFWRAALKLGTPPQQIVTLVDGEAEQAGITYSTKAHHSAAQLSELAALVAVGELVLPPPRRFPLSDAAAAHEATEHGHGRGKIVINS